jgi:hypothetical protein
MRELSEKEFKKLIQKHIDKVDFVKVLLFDDSLIFGFIVKYSDEFLMIEEAGDFSLDGIKIIPYETVRSIRHNKFDKAKKIIYNEENLIKLSHKIIDKTSLQDFKSLFKSIKKQDLHCIVESRKNKKDIFSIGEILEITDESVTIKNYDATGKTYKKPDEIAFKNIELVNFNDNYSKTFRKYLK